MTRPGRGGPWRPWSRPTPTEVDPLAGEDDRLLSSLPRPEPGPAPAGADAQPGWWRQGHVEARPRLQQGAVSHELAGAAEAEGGGEPTGSPVERDEATLLDRPVDHDDVVVGSGVPDHLDLDVVLVGPEVRNRDIGRGVAASDQQVARRRHALLGGVGPVLDPDVGTGPLVEPPGHVAGHHDVVGGVQGGVGDHTVGDLETGARQPRRGGDDPDTDDDHVGVDDPAVVELDTADVLVCSGLVERSPDTPTPV